jgi:hypothetical protein
MDGGFKTAKYRTAEPLALRSMGIWRHNRRWRLCQILMISLLLPGLAHAQSETATPQPPPASNNPVQTLSSNVKWFVDIKRDAVGKQTLEARVSLEDGFRMRLYLRKNKAIWGELKLPRSQAYGFHEERLPVLRVDNNLPHMLNELVDMEMGFQRNLSYVIGKRLRFMIWNSAKQGFIPPLLAEMMQGTTLDITYALASGNVELVSIPLQRANEAIAKFLNVKPLKETSDRPTEEFENFEQIARQHITLCDDMRFSGDDEDFGRCRRVFVACSEIPAQTVADFRKCLADS